eukprot:3245758-Rhodomonas_salina.5
MQRARAAGGVYLAPGLSGSSSRLASPISLSCPTRAMARAMLVRVRWFWQCQCLVLTYRYSAMDGV